MGGVAAVATHAAYRRRGYAGELMRAALRGMRERSVHLSMLHPFAHAFYRRYGWELATEAISYELKPRDLPTDNEQKYVRAYRDGDLHRMMVLLEGEASRHPLSVHRDEGRWRQLLDRGEQEAAVYEAEAGIEGYLLYDLREGDGSPHTLVLSELITATPAARRALISFAAAFDPLMFAVKYSASRGEPLHPYLENSYVNARLAPEFMLRLVDVEQALKLLRLNVNTLFVLEVTDDVIPENAGEYTIAPSGATTWYEARRHPNGRRSTCGSSPNSTLAICPLGSLRAMGSS
jgi:predicted acetyltransferase